MKAIAVKRVIPLLISTLVFGVCLWYLVVNFQWLEIARLAQQANWGWLLGAGTITLLAFCVFRGLRWYLLLKNLGISIDFLSLYLCNVSVMCLTVLTPFQSGEVLKVELLKRQQLIERFSGYSSFVVERVIDLLVVVSIAAVSLLSNLNLGINRSSVFYLWLVLLLGCGIGVFALRRVQVGGRLGTVLQTLRDCTRNVNVLLLVIGLTVCAWLAVAIGWLVCLQSIQVQISLVDAIALTSTMTLVNILSFIPGAVGISEVGITEFLLRLGIDPPAAQAGAIAIRLYAVLLIGVSGLHWLLWRFTLSQRRLLSKRNLPSK